MFPQFLVVATHTQGSSCPRPFRTRQDPASTSKGELSRKTKAKPKVNSRDETVSCRANLKLEAKSKANKDLADSIQFVPGS